MVWVKSGCLKISTLVNALVKRCEAFWQNRKAPEVGFSGLPTPTERRFATDDLKDA